MVDSRPLTVYHGTTMKFEGVNEMHIRRFLIEGHYWLGLARQEGLILISYLGPQGDRVSMNGYGTQNF